MVFPAHPELLAPVVQQDRPGLRVLLQPVQRARLVQLVFKAPPAQLAPRDQLAQQDQRVLKVRQDCVVPLVLKDRLEEAAQPDQQVLPARLVVPVRLDQLVLQGQQVQLV
jgi:hypothetical protein